MLFSVWRPLDQGRWWNPCGCVMRFPIEHYGTPQLCTGAPPGVSSQWGRQQWLGCDPQVLSFHLVIFACCFSFWTYKKREENGWRLSPVLIHIFCLNNTAPLPALRRAKYSLPIIASHFLNDSLLLVGCRFLPEIWAELLLLLLTAEALVVLVETLKGRQG